MDLRNASHSSGGADSSLGSRLILNKTSSRKCNRSIHRTQGWSARASRLIAPKFSKLVADWGCCISFVVMQVRRTVLDHQGHHEVTEAGEAGDQLRNVWCQRCRQPLIAPGYGDSECRYRREGLKKDSLYILPRVFRHGSTATRVGKHDYYGVEPRANNKRREDSHAFKVFEPNAEFANVGQ